MEQKNMRLSTPKHWALLLVLGLLLLGCGQGADVQSAPPAEVAEAPAVTETATLEPSETPEPTETATPEPTETPEPTDTATPEPTETPEPTDTATPEPTETPEPTNTPAPTATPRPTNTPVPVNTATPANTATPEPQPTADSITVYYISNPNDILGVFPVRTFDGPALRNNMQNIMNSLQTMSGAINGAKEGNAEACSSYVAAYNNILYSGVFYEDVPGDWQEIDGIYFISFIYSLDRTRPAYLSCVNSGKVDEFNYGLAVQTIGQTISFLQGGIDAANAK